MYRETEVEAKATRWAKVYHSSSVESFSALIGTYNEVQSFEKYIEEITKHACSSESRLYPLELLREQCTVLAQCHGIWYKGVVLGINLVERMADINFIDIQHSELISEQHIKHYPVRLEETKPLIHLVNCALKVINYKSKSAEQAFCEFRELTSNVFLVVLAMDYNENEKITYVDFLLNKADKKSSLCKKIFGPWDNDDDKVVTIGNTEYTKGFLKEEAKKSGLDVDSIISMLESQESDTTASAEDIKKWNADLDDIRNNETLFYSNYTNNRRHNNNNHNNFSKSSNPYINNIYNGSLHATANHTHSNSAYYPASIQRSYLQRHQNADDAPATTDGVDIVNNLHRNKRSSPNLPAKSNSCKTPVQNLNEERVDDVTSSHQNRVDYVVGLITGSIRSAESKSASAGASYSGGVVSSSGGVGAALGAEGEESVSSKSLSSCINGLEALSMTENFASALSESLKVVGHGVFDDLGEDGAGVRNFTQVLWFIYESLTFRSWRLPRKPRALLMSDVVTQFSRALKKVVKDADDDQTNKVENSGDRASSPSSPPSSSSLPVMCACKFIADFMELHFDGDVRVNDAVMKKVLDVVELLKMAMFYQNFKIEIKEELYALITTFDKFYKRRHALTQTGGETVDSSDVGITPAGSKEAVDRDDERFLNGEKSYSPPVLQNVWCHPTTTTTRSSTATKPTTLSTTTTVQRNSEVTQTEDVKNSRAISKSGELSCMPGNCATLMDSSTDGSRSGSSLSDRDKLKNVAPLKTYHQHSHDDENDNEDEEEEKDDGNYESNSDHSNTEKRQPLKCAEPDVTSPSKQPPSSVDKANDSSCSSPNGYYNSEVDNDAKSLETKYDQVTKNDNRSFSIQTPSASSADESNPHDVASSIRSDVEKKLGNEKMITQDVLKPSDKCDNNNSTTIDGQTELGTFDLSYDEKNVKWAFYKLTPKKDKGVDEHYGPKSKKNAKKQQQGNAVSASLSNTSLGNLSNVTADDDENFPPLSSSSSRNSNRNYDAFCNGEANETNKLHWLSDENKPLERQLKFGETVRCTNCHGVGHYSKYCTKPAKNTGFFC